METRDKNFFNNFLGKEISVWSVCHYTITKIGEITHEDTGYEDARCECEMTEIYEDSITGWHEERKIKGEIFYHDYAGWSVMYNDTYGKIK